MPTETLTPNSTILGNWMDHNYLGIVAPSDSLDGNANRHDDNEPEQWGTTAPVGVGDVSQVLLRVRHNFEDDDDGYLSETMQCRVRVGGAWSAYQGITTSTSGWVYSEALFTGSWHTGDFSDFAFEIKINGVSTREYYSVDHVEAVLTIESVVITTLYRLGGGDWSDLTKWSTTSGGAAANAKPAAGIDVIFDSNSSGTCVIDEDVEMDSLDCSFTGTLDAATHNHNVTINGNCTLACTDLSWGTGDWTVGDDVDFSGLTNYPSVVSSGVDRSAVSRLTMTGTGVTLTPKGVDVDTPLVLGALIVTGSISVQSYGALGYVLDNQGTITIDSGARLICRCSDANAEGLLMANGSAVSGLGTLWVSGTGIKQFGAGATIDCSALNFANTTAIDVVTCTLDSPTVTFTTGVSNAYQISGDVTFTGNVIFKALDDDYPASLVVDNSVHNPTLTFKGDLTFEESGIYQVVWTPGTGKLVFNGSGDQNINTLGRSVDAIEVDKSSGVWTQSGNVATLAFTATQGIVNHNGHNLTANDYTISANASYSGDQQGSTVTVGDELTLTGEDGDLLTINNLDFDLSGSSTVQFCDVTNSDASAGNQVVARDSVDSAGNSNWLFQDFNPAWASGSTLCIGAGLCT